MLKYELPVLLFTSLKLMTAMQEEAQRFVWLRSEKKTEGFSISDFIVEDFRVYKLSQLYHYFNYYLEFDLLNLSNKGSQETRLTIIIKKFPSNRTEKEKALITTRRKKYTFYTYIYTFITRFFSSSHPKPPAPMTRTLQVSNKNWRDCKEWKGILKSGWY